MAKQKKSISRVEIFKEKNLKLKNSNCSKIDRSNGVAAPNYQTTTSY